MGKNIIMIGMPGSGKSTIGVVLAKTLCYEFVDCDLVIQRVEGKPLHEIIEQEGVEGFLAVEDRVNATIEAQNAVIATGGSAVYGAQAMAHLKRDGVALYLKLDYDEVAARLGDLRARGVALRDGQSLRDAYDERCKLYEQYADITVDGNGKTISETLVAAQEALRAAGVIDRPMRRHDRAIVSRAEQLEVIRQCEVCRLAISDGEVPYLLPLSFGEEERDGALTLYFHGALTGTKYELFARHPRVSFEMDCAVEAHVDANACISTMYYKSVIGVGRIELLSGEEAEHGLRVLLAHYGQDEWTFNPAALAQTQVFCLRVERMTAKARRRKK
jgi:shikimate kinase